MFVNILFVPQKNCGWRPCNLQISQEKLYSEQTQKVTYTYIQCPKIPIHIRKKKEILASYIKSVIVDEDWSQWMRLSKMKINEIATTNFM